MRFLLLTLVNYIPQHILILVNNLLIHFKSKVVLVNINSCKECILFIVFMLANALPKVYIRDLSKVIPNK